MSIIVEQRVFNLNHGCVFSPDEYWNSYSDGTFTPEDRKIFLAEYAEHGEQIALELLSNHERGSAERIAKILKAEADWRPETAAEKEAKRLAVFQQKNLEMAELKRDLRFWDTNSDQ
jgi:hypothetical protein